jgi:hypothetical protein
MRTPAVQAFLDEKLVERYRSLNLQPTDYTLCKLLLKGIERLTPRQAADLRELIDRIEIK